MLKIGPVAAIGVVLAFPSAAFTQHVEKPGTQVTADAAPRRPDYSQEPFVIEQYYTRIFGTILQAYRNCSVYGPIMQADRRTRGSPPAAHHLFIALSHRRGRLDVIRRRCPRPLPSGRLIC